MTGKGNEAYEKFDREFAERNAALLEALIIPRAPFDYDAPLPDLHIQKRSWEPAARHYRDLTPAEKLENERNPLTTAPRFEAGK